MGINVHARLPTRASNIDPDIVAVRCVLFFDFGFRTIQQSEDSRFLIPRHIEEVCDMPSGNHQHVSGAQAVIVETHIGMLILEQHHVRFA